MFGIIFYFHDIDKSMMFFRVYIVVFICAFVSVGSQAQVPSISEINRAVSQANMHMRFIDMHMFHQNWLYNADYLLNEAYDFNVIMKDGSSESVISKIYSDTSLRKSYLVKKNKNWKKKELEKETKIYVDQTREISRVNSYLNTTVRGLATDSCWQFKILEGPISAYSFLSEITGANTLHINAYSVGNGPILPFLAKELKKYISEVPQALSVFEKEDYYKAIKIYNRKKLREASRRK